LTLVRKSKLSASGKKKKIRRIHVARPVDIKINNALSMRYFSLLIVAAPSEPLFRFGLADLG
jgi:hypothetical protein